ncbi:MAG: glycosyltransferase [Bacteroidetes bacterium]|nr:glycosyltransferase [Bacteroidota bacterium]
MKILYLTSRFPYPLEKGDKLRAYEFIKHLSKNHEIILFALNETEVTQNQLAQLQPYCSQIHTEVISKINSYFNLIKNIIGYLPFSVVYFKRYSAQSKIDALISEFQPDHIVCHLIRMSEYVKHIDKIPKTLDYMDAFGMGMSRLGERSSFPMSMFARMEQKRLEWYEESIYEHFENHIIISEQDRQHITKTDGGHIHIVPNGVDLDYFNPAQVPAKKYDLLFAGNMNYPPNIETVLFIHDKVLPLLYKDFPDLKFVIAGDNPDARVKALASGDGTNRVTVTGWVDDIRPYFYESKLLFAPMQISIGLQNKILQAMAMQTPCVISNLANNAIHATHGVQAYVGSQPEEYAAHITKLLNSEAERNNIANNAIKFVRENFDWRVIIQQFEKTITPE